MYKAISPLVPFETFLTNFSSELKKVLHSRGDIDKIALQRGMPPFVMREILNAQPLSVGIPSEFGGRGCRMDENLAMLEVASYESLSLALILGINSALFLQPLAKYGQEEIKQPIFERFLTHQHMGGLMMTEPGHGSDALNMQTSYSRNDGKFHLRGEKHWAGLTGWADLWLIAAREKGSDGNLKRDLDFFISDENCPGQHIEVLEVFNNLGLYQIPYGRNRVDVQIPENQRLIPESTGVKMLLDMLHRSRLQFPGMAIGFIHRLLDESVKHTQQRSVGGRALISYDQVQYRLSRLQGSYAVVSAMCAYSSEMAGIQNNLSQSGFEANCVKSITSDLMQEAAQSATQLIGAQAFKLDNIAGRGIVDSRPFQIFEGSNDILYAQISESLMRLMKRARKTNLYRFLIDFDSTEKAAGKLRSLLDFNLDFNLTQRKLVELGKVLSRIVSSQMVIILGEKGFHKRMVSIGLNLLEQDITSLLGSFNFKPQPIIVEDYSEKSSWRNLI
jgi:alkylation response protein AidB-like acyl-CoA dehydrogenase